jgi:hypothetical protein
MMKNPTNTSKVVAVCGMIRPAVRSLPFPFPVRVGAGVFLAAVFRGDAFLAAPPPFGAAVFAFVFFPGLPVPDFPTPDFPAFAMFPLCYPNNKRRRGKISSACARHFMSGVRPKHEFQNLWIDYFCFNPFRIS